MKTKQHWLEETYIGHLIDSAVEGWGRIFLNDSGESVQKKKVTAKSRKTRKPFKKVAKK
tara:strand:+ start:599 stop:775 length:177 start_codon:yes stop_codon:yes gene_type:complete